MNNIFANRDISWLSFNGRVLNEASSPEVPLFEAVKFLSIYSSNLDEFYRVRMPVLQALKNISQDDGNGFEEDEHQNNLDLARATIEQQQDEFGRILTQIILPGLSNNGIQVIYNQDMPPEILEDINNYFYSQVLAFLHPVYLDKKAVFFLENSQLYFLVSLKSADDSEQLIVLNIPSNSLPRFLSLQSSGQQYIIFLDDIIRTNLHNLFKEQQINWCHSFKVTRTAELDLQDEYPGDLSEEIEAQLARRDHGLATRFLYEPDIPLRILVMLCRYFNISIQSMVPGGRYHNLKDMGSLPIKNPELSYKKWPGILHPVLKEDESLLDRIRVRDEVLHPPYQSYQTILRFFNEAANDPKTEAIYVTLYRVANDSRIVNALISAAKNGKDVQVVVELKARFDEANNIKWAKIMKAAGVKIYYSITSLKVHAKIALVKRKLDGRLHFSGLLATGNLNESTAAFYTDHILLTSNPDLLREVDLLFIFLFKREKPSLDTFIKFKHLLVAQFNLQERFLQLIDEEIALAKQGLPASITIKLNNLEEELMINKLYEASRAGVTVFLIIRGICRLIPGVKDLSETITVKRIVDRYLEHGRIFLFNNNGNPKVFMGSADWMDRNIYRRIEVCFPVYDEDIKNQIIQLLAIQQDDEPQQNIYRYLTGSAESGQVAR